MEFVGVGDVFVRLARFQLELESGCNFGVACANVSALAYKEYKVYYEAEISRSDLKYLSYAYTSTSSSAVN